MVAYPILRFKLPDCLLFSGKPDEKKQRMNVDSFPNGSVLNGDNEVKLDLPRTFFVKCIGDDKPGVKAQWRTYVMGIDLMQDRMCILGLYNPDHKAKIAEPGVYQITGLSYIPNKNIQHVCESPFATILTCVSVVKSLESFISKGDKSGRFLHIRDPAGKSAFLK